MPPTLLDNEEKQKIDNVMRHVKAYPDFPKAGILFRDFFPIFRDPLVLQDMIDVMVHHINKIHPSVQLIVGLESRGFMFGPILSLAMKIPFVPIRKPGKLPGKVKKVSYSLEYANDSFELQSDSVSTGQKCVIVDDLLATGGSMNAAARLVEEAGGLVVECIVLIELIELNGRKAVSKPVHSLIQY